MYKKILDFTVIPFSLVLVLIFCVCSIPKIQVVGEIKAESTYKTELVAKVSINTSILREPLTDVLYFYRPRSGYQVMLDADGLPVTYDQYVATYGAPDES